MHESPALNTFVPYSLIKNGYFFTSLAIFKLKECGYDETIDALCSYINRTVY
jgi:hypothetical protein